MQIDKFYSFWDIPSVMLASLDNVIEAEEEAMVTFVNADEETKKEALKRVIGTSVTLDFRKVDTS